MLKATLRYLFAMLWGAVPALLLFFCLHPLRKRRLQTAGLYSPFSREAVLALFWMFCGGIAIIALTPRWLVRSLAGLLQGADWNPAGTPFFMPGNISLTLFRTFSYSSYVLVGNIVLFLPFGLFAALLWRGFGWRRALLTGVCITGLIELCQLFVGRTFDIDDLMLNTFGVLCGFWLALAVKGLFPSFARQFQVQSLYS